MVERTLGTKVWSLLIYIHELLKQQV
jgi:hypothetical protein